MDKFLIHEETKTVIDADNHKILHYGYDDFIERIVSGYHCFVCGAAHGTKQFNNEHVIPKWVLKHFGTPDSFMVLPNGTTIKNSAYTVPCCQDCNTELGVKLETPISNILKQGYNYVSAELEKDENLYLKLFHWVSLLFFKSHLKDTYLDMNRDQRKASGSIADIYCWHPLYHIHQIARQHYTEVKIERDVIGTIVVLEALKETLDPQFDYLDNINSQVMMVKVGSVVIFVVLNDSRFCLAGHYTFLSKITGAMNSIQIREVFARLRYLNDNIKERPRFHVLFKDNIFSIGATIPGKIEFYQGKEEKVSLFKYMRLYIEELIPLALPERDQIVKDLEEGKAQYVLDEKMNFFQHKGYENNLGVT